MWSSQFIRNHFLAWWRMSAIILSNTLLTTCGRGSALSVYRTLTTFGRASWEYFATRFDLHPNKISLVININNLL